MDDNLFSFTSKYCTLHAYFVYKKDDFAIFDNVVATHIWEYTDKLPTKNSARSKYMVTKNYTGWVSLINEIVRDNNITTAFPKRKLDWLIWLKNRKVK